MRHLGMGAVGAGVLVWLAVGGAAAADATPGAVPAGGPQPGAVLSKDNWQEARDLLPAEILRHYERGEYANRVIAWPLGLYLWDPDFAAATQANRGKYDVSPQGTVVGTSTGTQPPFVYGFPFPDIDPKDPQAAVKILWNFEYQYWNDGNSHNVTMLNWMSPERVERETIQTVHFLFYDGQGAQYRIPNPNNFSVQFIAVTSFPADLNGTASLTWRYRDAGKRDSNWVYVPALRRVRAVSPANRSDGFLGSDMSQDDGPFFDGKPEDFTWTLVGDTEMLRLVDPLSFEGKGDQAWLPSGGWRAVWPDIPVAGFQDRNWHGAAWAPVAAALARRPFWVIEGVPKDKYYLYGKLQLYIDKESYQGAWNRKFGWDGQLLNTVQVIAWQRFQVQRPDGTREWLWRSNFAYQCAEHVKLNRATVAGLLPRHNKDVPNDRRVRYDPTFFDSATLQRFSK